MMLIHHIFGLISPHFRRRRLRWFRDHLPASPDERLIDIGGYPWCWLGEIRIGSITLLNREFEPGLPARHPEFVYTKGDACALPFADHEFDVAFSNSVIEHVGTWGRQERFAAEARRIGRKLWIQTPARGFFIEPHLLAPFIHWLPVRWQRRLMRRFTPWGWLTRAKPADVDAFLTEVRLLTKEEMQRLFPDCEILEEKFLGMTKSYIALRTAPPASSIRPPAQLVKT